MPELEYTAKIIMGLGCVTALLSIILATFRKHKYSSWFLLPTLVLYLVALSLAQISYNIKVKSCEAKHAAYLQDQDACFKLIEMK